MHELAERVECIEEELASLKQETSELTTAVRDLTNVLVSGKLAVRIVFYIASVGVGITTAVYWVLTHVTFNGAP